MICSLHELIVFFDLFPLLGPVSLHLVQIDHYLVDVLYVLDLVRLLEEVEHAES